MTSLSQLTACETASLVAAGQASVVEVVTALLEQIGRTDPKLAAWECVAEERALDAARRADSARAVGGAPGPLDGVCLAVKDVVDTAGVRTAAGFPPFDDRVPSVDADVVRDLEQAAGIMLGKVATAQFALSDPPPTVSPWDPDRTPGGSSTGSGVAVAARHVPMAIGTQTGGSVLRPAAFNGVVGFKPTFGSIGVGGLLPTAPSLDHIGVLARSVDDCSYFASVLSARGGSAHASTRDGTYTIVPPGPPRLGLIGEAVSRADDAVSGRFEEAVGELEAHGATVEPVELPDSMEVLEAIYWVTMRSELATVHDGLLQRHRDGYGPQNLLHIEIGRLIPARSYLRGQRLREALRARFDEFVGGFDALVLPTVPHLPPAPSSTGSSSFLSPFSVIGAPSASVPCGTVEGLPQGLQVVGRVGHDGALLDTARWCEQALRPAPAPPGIIDV